MIAAISQLGTLALLAKPFLYTQPIGRFGGLIFLVLASLLLPLTRPRTNTGATS